MRAIRDARSQRREMQEILEILLPVFGSPPRHRRARDECLDPPQVAAEARRALTAAGRQDIPVRIWGEGECVSLGARYAICCRVTDDGRFVATLTTITLRNWRWQKRDARKWKALREAVGD
jgi:L-alanine-DL-glutamate epimerase-like enolase superfamily enzyme